jgi:hypothetical protein
MAHWSYFTTLNCDRIIGAYLHGCMREKVETWDPYVWSRRSAPVLSGLPSGFIRFTVRFFGHNRPGNVTVFAQKTESAWFPGQGTLHCRSLRVNSFLVATR